MEETCWGNYINKSSDVEQARGSHSSQLAIFSISSRSSVSSFIIFLSAVKQIPLLYVYGFITWPHPFTWTEHEQCVCRKGVASAASMRTRRLTEMLLDSFENVHAVVTVHHVDGQPSLSEAPRPADPVEVRLVVWVSIFIQRQVKVNHHRNLLHIDAWRPNITFITTTMN